MLVQDPLSGYLHEVPDAHPHYGSYAGGYYGGYDEYVDPSMAEYPGELGLPFLLPKIIGAITGGRRPPPPPPLPLMTQTVRPNFMPSPGLRAYIAAVVREVIAQTPPGVNPMFSQGGFRRRRRRR